MSAGARVARWGGVFMALATAAMIPAEYGAAGAYGVAAICTLIALALFFTVVTWSRRIFVLIGLGLFVLSVAVQPDWSETAARALRQGSFIAGFFTALTAIRSAASGSREIDDCGRFLAGQPPGRRYLALTIGGHLFGLVLSYGALSLLGGLATESAAKETNAEIRGHRIRRMLLAIQRGFISCLTWSPLGFAVVVTTSLVPGARWADAVAFCLVSTALLVGIGWALDSIFKPRLSAPAPPREPAEGHWFARLRPLLILLALLFVLVGGLHLVTGVRVVGAVMTVAPALALVWAVVQPADPGAGAHLRRAGHRAARFVTVELPSFGPEMVLLIMAAIIGTIGSSLAAPVMAASGIDLAAIPAAVLLVVLVWIIPLTGQLGMNPILSVSLFAPLLPSPAALGIHPTAMIVAITGGWALSGATSPFTASTLLIARFGGVRPIHAGLRWNGAYAALSASAVSLWAVLLAYLL